jgi:outer membrane protein TolC
MKKFLFAFGLALFLRSPVMAAPTFNEVINSAVENLEEVRGKESELRAAEITRRQSIYNFLPDLNLAGTYSETGTELDHRDVDRSYGLSSTLNLFRFGGDLNSYQSADFTSQGLKFDLQNTRLRMEESLVLKSLELIASHQETEIRKKLIVAQRSFFDVAEKRYARGILSRQELDQVTIDFRIAEARLKDAALTEFKNKEALKVYFKSLTGSQELPEVLLTAWPWLQKLEKGSFQKIKFRVEDHPAWKQLQSRVQASELLAKAKFSSLWPSLDLTLKYSNEIGVVTNDRWLPQWAGLVTLTIPIFNRLENYSNYQLSRETELRERLSLERSTRELTANWTTAETEFLTQLSSALTREQTLKVSHTLYQDNLRRFQAGRTSANDLFNDQDRLYQAELLVVQGWRAAHESYLRLCHSLGQSLSECKF